jgi:Family of unknown function (DUF5706)
MNVDEQTRIAESNLGRLLDWIGRVDAKSSVVLGICTAMLGAFAGLAPAPHLWTSQTAFLAAFGVICPITSLFCVYLVNYPQTKGPATSLNFFGGIAKRSFREYNEAFMKVSATEHLSDVLEQCHRNAEIVSRKFSSLKWAYRTLLIGVIPWMVCLYYFRSVSDAH